MNNEADQPVEATKPQAMDIARLVKRWWGGDQQAEMELQKRADQMVSSIIQLNIKLREILWTPKFGDMVYIM